MTNLRKTKSLNWNEKEIFEGSQHYDSEKLFIAKTLSKRTKVIKAKLGHYCVIHIMETKPEWFERLFARQMIF